MRLKITGSLYGIFTETLVETTEFLRYMLFRFLPMQPWLVIGRKYNEVHYALQINKSNERKINLHRHCLINLIGKPIHLILVLSVA